MYRRHTTHHFNRRWVLPITRCVGVLCRLDRTNVEVRVLAPSEAPILINQQSVSPMPRWIEAAHWVGVEEAELSMGAGEEGK